MEINPDIFKAYDIRGIYPGEIDEKAAYLIGQSFVKFLKKRTPRIVIGRDGRLSSPFLFKFLAKGIISQGANVIDIGPATSPMFYFAVAHYGFDGGVNITASHLGKNYNGFKLVREKALPISEKTGLKEIKKLAYLGKFKKKKKGKILQKRIIPNYLKFNFKDFYFQNLRQKPLKIVIDTANAAGGILIPGLKKKLPATIFPLFEKLNGDFPNHNPDPLLKENLRFLKKEIQDKKADLGVALDGDGDRIIFLDEKGQVVSGDLITALISSLILRETPGEKILYDVRSSNIVKETIKKEKGIPVVSRIGHAFIKAKMRKENISFGGELSGHYYSKEHYFSEAPLFVLLKILEEISKTQKKFSQLIKPFRKYFHSGEINFKVKNREKIFKNLATKYQKGKISKLDGLKADFKDWWFNIRPSQTEPVLRLVIEAKTKKLMEEKIKEIKLIIENPAPEQVRCGAS